MRLPQQPSFVGIGSARQLRQFSTPIAALLKRNRLSAAVFLLSACTFGLGLPPATAQDTAARLAITRTVRPWEFLSVTGKRAGLFGNESGRMEAWVYPLKLLRNFSLTFHTEDRALPAETLARTITVTPEATTILYVSDTFRVQETIFVPVDEPGAILRLEVETEKPLEIEASFQKDFQLEWPAGLGGTYLEWDADLHGFVLGEEGRKFAAIIGSPSGVLSGQEFLTNYSASNVNALKLGTTQKGKSTKIVVLAGSVTGLDDAKKEFQKLCDRQPELQESSANYYADYLQRTVQLELPDGQLQQAYDWSRISILQGVVTNPFLGTGLVAGYRTSGETQRPGFAWYFGRDFLLDHIGLEQRGRLYDDQPGAELYPEVSARRRQNPP